MSQWEILAGLPPYGPEAIGFSSTGQGKHREGFVVRFHSLDAEAWVGNFQSGFTSLRQVLVHPNGVDFIVIAGGTAYIVSSVNKTCIQTFGGQIVWTKSLPNHQLVLAASLTDVIAIGVNGICWRSQRISWDGLRNLTVSNDELVGEAYTPLGDKWLEFRVDLKTGAAIGGSYNEVR